MKSLSVESNAVAQSTIEDQSILDGGGVWLRIRNNAKFRGSDKINTYFKKGGDVTWEN